MSIERNRYYKDKVTSAIGKSDVRKLVEEKTVSNATKAKVVQALSESIKNLERGKAELNSNTSKRLNEVQEATLQAQNELLDEKLKTYSALHEYFSQQEPRMRRSNSADNLLQDTYIRRVLSAATNAFGSIATEANSLSHDDYVALQRSRLPESARNNPEVLARLSAGYALYKGVAKVGEGLSVLDDATGNVVSGTLQKVGEWFEWIGTQTRRFVRDDLGYGQRIGQNA